MKRILLVGVFSILGAGLFGQEIPANSGRTETGEVRNSQVGDPNANQVGINGEDQPGQQNLQIQQQNRQVVKQVPADQQIKAQIQAQSQVSRMQMRQMRTAQKQQNRAIQAVQQQKQFQRRNGHK